MSLKASALKKNESQNKTITKETTSILRQIDDELKVAHESGKHGCSIAVPINFSVPFMKNRDAQRVVYYKILSSLIERKFNPKIELRKNSTVFHVSWLSDEEQEEINLQNLLLAKHTIKDVTKIDLSNEEKEQQN